MHIRPAREVDAPLLAKAEYDTAAGQEGLLAARPHEISVDAFLDRIRALREEGLYSVLEDEQGHIVGHLLLEPLGLAATRHVSQLTVVVHPGHTGKGYGRLLIEHAIRWARDSDAVEKIELRVRSTNPRAIALYELLGFVREGALRNRIKLHQGYADDICMALFVEGPGEMLLTPRCQ